MVLICGGFKHTKECSSVTTEPVQRLLIWWRPFEDNDCIKSEFRGQWFYIATIILTNLFGHIVNTTFIFLILRGQRCVLLNGVFKVPVKWLDEHSVILNFNIFYWNWKKVGVGCVKDSRSYTEQQIETLCHRSNLGNTTEHRNDRLLFKWFLSVRFCNQVQNKPLISFHYVPRGYWFTIHIGTTCKYKNVMFRHILT